jgi:hypothetical protein
VTELAVSSLLGLAVVIGKVANLLTIVARVSD